MARAPIDWEPIEADWRAGIKSKQQISIEFGVSRAAMDKRFAKLGIARDLAEKIQAKADALVTQAAVAGQVTPATAATEQAIVDANAQAVAGVRMAHRSDILRFRTLALSLLEELEAETGNIELFEELGEMLRSEDKAGQDKRNDLYRKVISSAGRIDSMKKLAETLRILVGLEREAYGIQTEAEKNPQTNMAELLKEIAASLPD